MLLLARLINPLKNIILRFKSKNISYYDFIKTFSELSNICFQLNDHMLLLNKIKAITFDSAFITKVDFLCNTGWLGETFATIILDLIDYFNYKKELNIINQSMKKILNNNAQG